MPTIECFLSMCVSVKLKMAKMLKLNDKYKRVSLMQCLHKSSLEGILNNPGFPYSDELSKFKIRISIHITMSVVEVKILEERKSILYYFDAIIYALLMCFIFSFIKPPFFRDIAKT